MRWNEIVTEFYNSSMVFGHAVPNWENVDEYRDVAFFGPAQVFLSRGKFHVYFGIKDAKVFKTSEDAEAYLKQRGATEFQGVDTFQSGVPNNA